MTKSRDLGNLAQTVAVNLPTALGTAGQSLVVNSGADGLEFGAASGGGVTVYTGLSGTDGTPSGATYLLNASSPSAGDLAYVTANTSLYQNNGNGWYRIAVINTTPTISSVADASSNTTPFTLEGGTNTVITVTASDEEEGTDLTYSHSVTSGSLNGTTVTQGTGANENVFTIAPHASNATTFSLTFTVSDSINAATSVAAFTLAFEIIDSHYTTLLVTTDGSAGDNNDITDAAGNHTSNITVNGDVYAGTFSPFRHGGYSVEFVDEGTNGYGLQLPDATFNNPSTTFTVEAWVYLKSYSNASSGHYNRAIMGKGATYLNFGVTSDYTLQLYHYDGTARYIKSTGTVPLNEWTHVCAKVDNSAITFYINGSSSGTGTWYGLDSGHVDTDFYVGTTSDSNANATKWWDGYLSNVRFVDGTAITPASGGNEALDPTTANTEFLLCASNRFIDSKSTSPLTVTPYRTPKIVPISPYDHNEYSASDNGGSVYLDGNSDYLDVSGGASLDLDSTDWTIEGWVYRTGTGSIQTFVNTAPPHTTLIISLNRTGGGNTQVYTGNGSSWVGSPAIDSGSNYPLLANEWSHVAVVKNGTTLYLYHNGKQAGSTTTLPSGFTGNFRIGAYESSGAQGEYLNGYVSDFRVAKEAVYTGEFTPPSGPLTTTGGTYPSTTNVDTSITAELLLSGTDAHVIDKSQNYNLELVGTAAAVTNATNNSTISSTNAISLDGNSDYIKPNDVILPITQGVDYTIEGWFYADTITGVHPIVSQYVSGNGGRFSVLVEQSVLKFFEGGSPRQTISVNTGTWYHF